MRSVFIFPAGVLQCLFKQALVKLFLEIVGETLKKGEFQGTVFYFTRK